MALFSKTTFVTFAGGAVAGIALAAVLMAGQAQAQRTIGSYTLQQHSNPNALAGVFRVNQATGYVSYCYIGTGPTPLVTCTRETP